MNDLVGIGRVLLSLSPEGLSDADWLELKSADVRILRPDGVIDLLPSVTLDVTSRALEVVYDVTLEGRYQAGIKLYFQSGSSMTSYRSHEFMASDGFH